LKLWNAKCNTWVSTSETLTTSIWQRCKRGERRKV